MLKRYLLFAGHNYYPNGGWSDFVCSFDSIEECQKHFDTDDSLYPFEWAQIVDVAEEVVVLAKSQMQDPSVNYSHVIFDRWKAYES